METLRVFGNRRDLSWGPLTDTLLPNAVRRRSSSLERMDHMCSARLSNSPATTSAAFPIPAMRSTFSVPARRPCSCPPPNKKFGKRIPRLTNKHAIPFGAPNLCPTMVTKSAPISGIRTGTLPTDWAASVCNRIFFFAQISAISPMGCNDPISLLLCMIVTSTVASVIANCTWDAETHPSESACNGVTSISPLSCIARKHSSTAGCSIFEVITCGTRPRGSRVRAISTAPRIA
mmetsp:Transcript_52172/g.138119  ORF Transcript_52172/g.138119 Transcript_52172/m.138119 type:complete len:233 (+) Transcript_52172:457-1155(+)